MKRKFLIISLFLISQTFISAQESQKYLLSSAQILKIMDTSKVIYQPTFIEDTTNFDFPIYPVLSENYYISDKGDSLQLFGYNLSNSGKSNYDLAESDYRNKKYSAAITYYNNILSTDSDFYKAYTFIGDCYYSENKYDSAIYFFKLEIEKNFIDYAAHWFLADTYKMINKIDSAVNEITIAHLLNRNNQNILKALMRYRNLQNRDWKSWGIYPICKTYKKDNNVIIETTENWLGYAMSEAVWKYEPSFTEDIFGKTYDGKSLIYQKEAAGIVANLNLKSMGKENSIIKDGYFQEMIWYEILAKKYPKSILLLPRDFFNKIIEYVNKYH